MTSHSKMLPIATIINTYVSSTQPYRDYASNLAALATRLRDQRLGDSWSLQEELCEHYVYVYLDPRKPGPYEYECPSGKKVKFDFLPVYVGKGKLDRIDSHLVPKFLKQNCPKNAKLNAIIRAGFDPREYRVLTPQRRTDWMAKALEIDLIAGIGRKKEGGPLTNLSAGGEGSTGYVPTAEQSRRKSLALTGKKRAPDVGQRIGAALRGRKRTEEHKANIRASLKGRVFTEREIQQFRESSATAKEVSIEGVLYPSSYAAARALGVHAATIQRWVRSAKKPSCYHT